MEDVLDVYARPHDPRRPQVCLDEGDKQLIGDVRPPLPVRPGRPGAQDYEYRATAWPTCSWPSSRWRGRWHVEVTERKTDLDLAMIIRRLVDEWYPEAERVVLVTDVCFRQGCLNRSG